MITHSDEALMNSNFNPSTTFTYILIGRYTKLTFEIIPWVKYHITDWWELIQKMSFLPDSFFTRIFLFLLEYQRLAAG